MDTSKKVRLLVAVATLLLTAFGLATTTAASAGSESVVIVITQDKVADPNDGWVRYSDGSRHWIDPACRSTLKAAGVPVEVLGWSEVSAMPDRDRPDCSDIPISGSASEDDPPQLDDESVGRAISSGVNLASAEYACVQNFAIFEHTFSVSDAELAEQFTSMGVETVRLPMNEHCWLGADFGFDYIPSQFRGEAYRSRIDGLVGELNQRGISVILDLHWSSATGPATGQQKMADARYAIPFWSSVASRFKDNSMVIFDAYNEPHIDSWVCWRDGCNVGGWETAGMQDLVNAIRSTGAEQAIILSGLDWAGDLRGWLDHVPNDSANNLVAGFHVYNRIHVDGTTYEKRCRDEACWSAELLPIIEAGYAVAATEVGQDVGLETCASDFVDRFYAWADVHNVPYLGWSYNPHGCGAPSLITSWDGTRSSAGEALEQHLNS